jgi:hypothetical protein
MLLFALVFFLILYPIIIIKPRTRTRYGSVSCICWSNSHHMQAMVDS